MEQNVEVVKESKKEDKKHFKKFIVIMLCSFLAGGLAGSGAVSFTKHYDAMDSYMMMYRLQMQSGVFFRILLSVLAVCYIAALAFCYKKAKCNMAECDIEDEEQFKSVEKRVELGLAVCGIGYLVLLLCFGMGTGAMTDTENRGKIPWILFTAVLFLGSIVALCFFQNRFIRMTKELYPGKKGSIFDTKFQKLWLQSCDEAEKLMIYQVCYKVFLTMNRVYSAAAAIFLVLSMIFGISSLIFLTIMVLWNISQGVYFYASAKIEKNFIQ